MILFNLPVWDQMKKNIHIRIMWQNISKGKKRCSVILLVLYANLEIKKMKNM